MTSAKRDDMRLISVILGTSLGGSTLAGNAKLLNYGFRFETPLVHRAGEPLALSRVWQGEVEELRRRRADLSHHPAQQQEQAGAASM